MLTNYEMQELYDEYCMDCYAEGTTPLSMWAWWESME